MPVSPRASANLFGIMALISISAFLLAAKAHSESQVRIIDEKFSEASPFSSEEGILLQKLEQSRELYKSKSHALAREIGRRFQMDFVQASKQYQEKRKELLQKTALLSKMGDLKQRNLELAELQASFQDPSFQRFLEASYAFENEMQKDHVFVGEMLARLEEILRLVIQQDPLFSYVFESKEFRERHGLLLKRVVWSIEAGMEVFAQTAPLDVYTVFADPAKAPMLVRFSSGAFQSVSFLRSVAIHELCHIYFYKELAGMEKFMGIAKALPQPSSGHTAGSKNLLSPAYQYFLVHEYYGFKTQLLFDEKFSGTSSYRLDAETVKYVGKMKDWTFSQLNERNRRFVEENPVPPVIHWIKQYYGR